MITFYLIRHGEKEAVPFDPPLTQAGVKQAEATADTLSQIKFHTIIASPKLRALQTAHIIAQPHHKKVKTDLRLVERMEWENEETFADFLKEWSKTDMDRKYRPKKGNSSAEKGANMKKVIDELSSKYQDGNIAFVTHGGSIGDLLRHLFDEKSLPHEIHPTVKAPYIEIMECSITKVQRDKDDFKLLKLNDISHLSMPLI
ncbi:MAG TPA: histidine phosphatase family protein [Patescibacteria group bacterium]|nr:histidine phosphatase family protein [Patescibacteria group bacterium]